MQPRRCSGLSGARSRAWCEAGGAAAHKAKRSVFLTDSLEEVVGWKEAVIFSTTSSVPDLRAIAAAPPHSAVTSAVRGALAAARTRVCVHRA